MDLNAAQHLHLSRFAARYRCNIGQLALSLSLLQIESWTGDEQAQDYHATVALLRFATAGHIPARSNSPDLPVEISPEANARERARHAVKRHHLEAVCVRHSQGEAVDFEEEDEKREQLLASLN